MDSLPGRCWSGRAISEPCCGIYQKRYQGRPDWHDPRAAAQTRDYGRNRTHSPSGDVVSAPLPRHTVTAWYLRGIGTDGRAGAHARPRGRLTACLLTCHHYRLLPTCLPTCLPPACLSASLFCSSACPLLPATYYHLTLTCRRACWHFSPSFCYLPPPTAYCMPTWRHARRARLRSATPPHRLPPLPFSLCLYRAVFISRRNTGITFSFRGYRRHTQPPLRGVTPLRALTTFVAFIVSFRWRMPPHHSRQRLRWFFLTVFVMYCGRQRTRTCSRASS